jgi:MFS family permease
MGAVFPFVTRTAKELHASDAAIGWINAAPFLGNLLAPIWARQMEGKAKMPFCVWSWTIARLLLCLMPFAIAPWPFALLILSVQFLGTISSPAYTTLMKDIYPDDARGRLMGYVRATMQLVMFFSTLLAGRLLDHVLTYRQVFPVAGLFGIGAAVCFSKVRVLRSAPVHVAESASISLADALSPLRDNIGFRWFALSVMFYGLGNLMAQPLYQLFQVERLHVTNTDVANLANAASLSAVVGAFFWGRVLDFWGAAKTVFVSIGLISAIAVVYLFATTLPPLYIGAALSGFGLAGVELSYMGSILSFAEPGKAARYQSLHQLLLGIRGILAPLIAFPMLRHFGWHVTFVFTLILMTLGTGLQLLAVRRDRSR